jgi:dCMP deaminase
VAIYAKDLISDNTHPLNLVERDDFAPEIEVDRPPLFEVYMRMAEELAKRSTCARLQVGTVITGPLLENVVAIGYNGNARGFPNHCDSTEPGKCGCIHSEQNALVKSPGTLRDKVAFVTASPCAGCAKLIIQANVSYVFYREAYRDSRGIEILGRGGVVPVHYTRWQHEWRGRSDPQFIEETISEQIS